VFHSSQKNRCLTDYNCKNCVSIRFSLYVPLNFPLPNDGSFPLPFPFPTFTSTSLFYFLLQLFAFTYCFHFLLLFPASISYFRFLHPLPASISYFHLGFLLQHTSISTLLMSISHFHLHPHHISNSTLP
jgi:hypothetical protein